MNNYDEYYKFINSVNNVNNLDNMNMNMINEQKKNDNNFKIENDPYTAFMRGNLFTNLYTPYRNYKPAQLNPKTEKEYALLMVQMYDFCAHELTLYLDNNPNDANAIKLRMEYMNMAKQALAQYESMYGPLELTSETLSAVPWAWDSKYWPWEGNK